MSTLKKIIQIFLLGIIRFYQLAISPYFPSSCRYTPTCSQYAVEAIKSHGPFRGSILAVQRIGKCHPWSDGGHDPVPQTPHSHPKEAFKASTTTPHSKTT